MRFVETAVTTPRELGSRYKISENLRSMDGQDGAVLLDLGQGRMFSANPVGCRILALMKDGSSESAIAEAISREFEVSRETAERNVREFLAKLAENKLIEALDCENASSFGPSA